MRANIYFLLFLALLSSELTGCSGLLTGLERPNGVAAAQDGSLYVMDKGNHRIVKLDANGKILDSFGKLGKKDAQIYFGWDIELDTQENIYINNIVAGDAGTEHEATKAFSPDGRFLRYIWQHTQPYEYSFAPYTLEIDAQGRIYIGDYNPGVIRIYSPAGEHIASLFGDSPTVPDGGPGNGFQFQGLGDLVVDGDIMYVADFYNGTIEKFSFGPLDSTNISAAGFYTYTHLLTFGEYGRDPGQMAYPQGIAIDRQNQLIFVGDQGNRRIQVFTTQGEYVRHFSPPLNNLANNLSMLNSTSYPLISDWQVLGLDFGPDGVLYAADTLNNVIWAFSPQGEMLHMIEARP